MSFTSNLNMKFILDLFIQPLKLKYNSLWVWIANYENINVIVSEQVYLILC